MIKKLLVVISLFSFSTNVYAGHNDTVVNHKYIDNPLYYEYKILNDWSVDSIQGNLVTINGQVVYCIEPGIRIIEGQLYSSHNYYDLNISKEQLDYYKKVAYYGYGYKEHTDHWWKAATQMLIWESSGLVREVYASYDVEGNNRVGLDSYKNEILRLVRRHDEKPTFDNNTFTIYEGDELIIEDASEMLEYYKLKEDNKNVSIFGNTMTIKGEKPGVMKLDFIKEMEYKSPNLIYSSPGSQKLITIGNVEPVESTLTINVLEKEKIISEEQNIQDKIPINNNQIIKQKEVIKDENKIYYELPKASIIE